MEIDKNKLQEMLDTDNTKLKEMMLLDPDTKTDEEQEEFFKEFKKSTLIVPMKEDYNPVVLEVNGLHILPLFTDYEEFSKVEKTNDIKDVWIKTEFIGDLIYEFGRVDEIVINPGSASAVGMNKDTLFSIFRSDNLKELEEIIKQEGQTLHEETRFYLREDKPGLYNEAVDGIFTSPIPFPADFIDKYEEGLEYLNILIVPKGTRHLIVGQSDNVNDTVFAPVIKFKLIDQNDKVYTWRCISQELNYKPTSHKLIYLIVAIIIIISIILVFIFLI